MASSCRIERVPLSGHEAAVRIFPAGRKQAPTIIALHGFTGSGLDFMPLREAMNPEAWNWICPDFLGHGMSSSPCDKAPYSLENALQLIDCTRKLTPAGSDPHLLGYSMGGRIALHYLMHAKPIACAVIGASPGISHPEARSDRVARDNKLVSLLLENGVDAFCEHWEAQPVIQPQRDLLEPLRTELYNRRRTNKATGLANTLLALGTGALPSLWDKIGRLTQLSCFYGERDRKFSGIAAEMAFINSNILTRSVLGAGHSPHLETPDSLAPLVESVFSH